jgi:hypothetical protein
MDAADYCDITAMQEIGFLGECQSGCDCRLSFRANDNARAAGIAKY